MTIHDERGTRQPDRFEIVRGEVVPLMPTGGVHGNVESRVSWLLTNLEEAGLGLAFGGEVGVVVESEPQTVRGADGAFLLQEQLPHRMSSEGYLLTPPALVVEVVSPNDRASEVEGKVQEYLGMGVRVVWVVYPGHRTVTVHLPDGSSRTLRAHEQLLAPGVLDDINEPVSMLFKGLQAFPQTTQPPT